jgi:hypothetical protein
MKSIPLTTIKKGLKVSSFLNATINSHSSLKVDNNNVIMGIIIRCAKYIGESMRSRVYQGSGK